ncbi:formylglycine-generating enzyme family protein [Treponema primitia]|uniref:formylglycine-generating enzyme family protein n=1 Tax=Treponema primitia TaxID=88058 RepID=UPI00397F2315
MKRMVLAAALLLCGVFAFAEDAAKPPVFFNGEGGRGTRLAVLAPKAVRLTDDDDYLPAFVQGSLTGGFNRFSAITVLDRQNMDRILDEQNLSVGGNFSDDDYIKIGNFTNTQYILAGNLTKINAGYILDLGISDAESGERKFSYPPRNCTAAEIQSGKAAADAVEDLLVQMGVTLTEAGKAELHKMARQETVDAEVVLSKGITAQKSGTVVEALSYYIQAAGLDPASAEAASRLNILSANVSSGNIGADARNEIAWRRSWLGRLQELEQYVGNYVNANPPVYLVYSTDLQQGAINWQNETLPISFTISLNPDRSWFDTITRVITTVDEGLQTTGKAASWGLAIGQERQKSARFAVVAELLNDQGVSIGRQEIVLNWSAKIGKSYNLTADRGKAVTFPAVKADLITDKLSIRITSIDGTAAETAARTKGINIITQAEYYRLPNIIARNGLVRIQGGTFTMGSPASERNRDSNETLHSVTVDSFYMSKYEVSQQEYEEVIGRNPSEFKGSNLPVEQVSWDDAVKYCNERSLLEGLTAAYTIEGNNVTWNYAANGYRLPTEAEWEYACRAGTSTPFNTGNNITTDQANYDGNNPYNNNAKGIYRQKTTAIGSFAPNVWGLYDMHGNVREWCWDWYGSYNSGAQTNPVGASSGQLRVSRGGSWGGTSYNYAQALRSAARYGIIPSRQYDYLGFRLVRPSL